MNKITLIVAFALMACMAVPSEAQRRRPGRRQSMSRPDQTANRTRQPVRQVSRSQTNRSRRATPHATDGPRSQFFPGFGDWIGGKKGAGNNNGDRNYRYDAKVTVAEFKSNVDLDLFLDGPDEYQLDIAMNAPGQRTVHKTIHKTGEQAVFNINYLMPTIVNVQPGQLTVTAKFAEIDKTVGGQTYRGVEMGSVSKELPIDADPTDGLDYAVQTYRLHSDATPLGDPNKSFCWITFKIEFIRVEL